MKDNKNRIRRFFLRYAAAAISAAVLAVSAALPVSAREYSAADFVHAEGRKIVGTDGRELLIRGMALGNSVWGNPDLPDASHHDEGTYRELSELGFNCVRFYINYGLFESDSEPYQYKESGFEWLDRNIAWAKKYGMGIIINMH